jgi:hypothetical protein
MVTSGVGDGCRSGVELLEAKMGSEVGSPRGGALHGGSGNSGGPLITASVQGNVGLGSTCGAQVEQTEQIPI